MTSYLQVVLRLKTNATSPYTPTCFQGPMLRVPENFRLEDTLTLPLIWCNLLTLRNKFGIMLYRKSVSHYYCCCYNTVYLQSCPSAWQLSQKLYRRGSLHLPQILEPIFSLQFSLFSLHRGMAKCQPPASQHVLLCMKLFLYTRQSLS